MKKALFLASILLSHVACKNETSKEISEEENSITAETVVEEVYVEKDFPNQVAAVFDAHGGMKTWDRMNNLCYVIPAKNGAETHTVSLKDRRTRIENEKWSIGYDGNEVWLLQNEAEAYKGNARFYHNLYFYFYAMPFVLADDGITYTDVEPLELEGELYHGTKISYNDGVGDSPKDEYIMYFNPDTNEMAWLAYTVTYMNNEKSDRWSFIKYEEWQKVNDLVLPKKLTWYATEDGKPTEARSSMEFEKVTATESILDNSIFSKPPGATVAPR